MSFDPGQKIECVSVGDCSPDQPYPWPASVILGGIYHVRDFERLTPDFAYLWIEEFIAPLWCGREVAFEASHFRLVLETKTDISIFTKLLTPNPQRRELVSSVIGEDINTL